MTSVGIQESDNNGIQKIAQKERKDFTSWVNTELKCFEEAYKQPPKNSNDIINMLEHYTAMCFLATQEMSRNKYWNDAVKMRTMGVVEEKLHLVIVRNLNYCTKGQGEKIADINQLIDEIINDKKQSAKLLQIIYALSYFSKIRIVGHDFIRLFVKIHKLNYRQPAKILGSLFIYIFYPIFYFKNSNFLYDPFVNQLCQLFSVIWLVPVIIFRAYGLTIAEYSVTPETENDDLENSSQFLWWVVLCNALIFIFFLSNLAQEYRNLQGHNYQFQISFPNYKNAENKKIELTKQVRRAIYFSNVWNILTYLLLMTLASYLLNEIFQWYPEISIGWG